MLLVSIGVHPWLKIFVFFALFRGALDRMQRAEVQLWNAFERIDEREQATGQVEPGIALEFERHGFGAAFDPDIAAHDALDAIVNLAAHHVGVNPKGHSY